MSQFAQHCLHNGDWKSSLRFLIKPPSTDEKPPNIGFATFICLDRGSFTSNPAHALAFSHEISKSLQISSLIASDAGHEKSTTMFHPLRKRAMLNDLNKATHIHPGGGRKRTRFLPYWASSFNPPFRKSVSNLLEKYSSLTNSVGFGYFEGNFEKLSFWGGNSLTLTEWMKWKAQRKYQLDIGLGMRPVCAPVLLWSNILESNWLSSLGNWMSLVRGSPWYLRNFNVPLPMSNIIGGVTFAPSR